MVNNQCELYSQIKKTFSKKYNLQRKILVLVQLNDRSVYQKKYITIRSFLNDNINSIIREIGIFLNEILPTINVVITNKMIGHDANKLECEDAKVILQEREIVNIEVEGYYAIQIILFSDCKFGILPGNGSITRINMKESQTKLEEVICDILLDSVLFHFYFGNLRTTDEYFRLKREYVIDKLNKKKSYWGIVKKDAPNPPLGSLITDRSNQYIELYASLWKDFANKIVALYSAHYNDDIFGNFLKKDELSRREIKNKIKSLLPGKYLLIGTNHRPKNMKKRELISSLFAGGHRRWKRNRIKIVPFNQGKNFLKWSAYLYFYPFVIRNNENYHKAME